MNVDKLMKRLKAVDAGKYGATFGEMTSVLDNCSGPLPPDSPGKSNCLTG